MVIVSAMSVPQVLAGLSGTRTLAAARYLAARMQGARTLAAATGAHVALQLVTAGPRLAIGEYRDGNHNGVRLADVGNGSDPPLRPEVVLADLFSGVRVVSADGGAPPDGAEIALYSFAPTGTSSSGTVYLGGEDRGLFAVRVLGATGRVRVLRFREQTRDWVDVR